MSGYAAFEDFIAGVEKLGEMNRLTAKEAEAGVLAAARETAAAGQAPDGTSWANRKEGGKALTGAAAAIESSTKGARVILKIGPPFVFHNFGAGGSSTTKEAARHRERTKARQAKSGTSSKFHAPQRRILPGQNEPMPEGIREAIADAAKKVFDRAMGGH